MEKKRLEKLLEDYKEGRIDITRALKKLEQLPYADLGFARVDHHRTLRRGVPEIILCQGKTPDQVAGIFAHMAGRGLVIATRAEARHWQAVKALHKNAVYHRAARMISNRRPQARGRRCYVAVVCAGTSDISVAEEAAVTAELLGCRAERLWDVGVAGIHRLFDKIEILKEASVIVAVAGMEGALPSVVSGLVSCPVIAVPTSVGYGASLGGLAALLTMLNSCSPGVAVVNIDNGFGAGYLAARIMEGRD